MAASLNGLVDGQYVELTSYTAARSVAFQSDEQKKAVDESALKKFKKAGYGILATYAGVTSGVTYYLVNQAGSSPFPAGVKLGVTGPISSIINSPFSAFGVADVVSSFSGTAKKFCGDVKGKGFVEALSEQGNTPTEALFKTLLAGLSFYWALGVCLLMFSGAEAGVKGLSDEGLTLGPWVHQVFTQGQILGTTILTGAPLYKLLLDACQAMKGSFDLAREYCLPSSDDWKTEKATQAIAQIKLNEFKADLASIKRSKDAKKLNKLFNDFGQKYEDLKDLETLSSLNNNSQLLKGIRETLAKDEKVPGKALKQKIQDKTWLSLTSLNWITALALVISTAPSIAGSVEDMDKIPAPLGYLASPFQAMDAEKYAIAFLLNFPNLPFCLEYGYRAYDAMRDIFYHRVKNNFDQNFIGGVSASVITALILLASAGTTFVLSMLDIDSLPSPLDMTAIAISLVVLTSIAAYLSNTGGAAEPIHKLLCKAMSCFSGCSSKDERSKADLEELYPSADSRGRTPAERFDARVATLEGRFEVLQCVLNVLRVSALEAHQRGNAAEHESLLKQFKGALSSAATKTGGAYSFAPRAYGSLNEEGKDVQPVTSGAV